MIERGELLTMAVDLAVQFHDDPMAYNTIAELPGADLKDEVVMLGGHMDSWHSGTGATDNAAGVAVAIEAVRILKALDLKPRRTIRIALWSGEEQGLLGSRAYVAEHFGKDGGRPGFGAVSVPTRKPEHATFSAYFNLDHGTGKVRGIYLQGNEAMRPIFRKWLQPFGEMGARTLSAANAGGTDHISFDGVGLPGFQFIQDWVDYNTRTHHSNQDVYDRIQADDMKQNAVIMAAFVYNTAMRDEKLPRKAPVAPTSGPGPTVPPLAVSASIETTLSTASGQIRQFAFDGDPGTFFASEQVPGSADHLSIVLDRPVTATSVAVVTGRPDGGDGLDAGTLEVSSDGTTFETLASFAGGTARGEPKDRQVRAIRIKPEAGLTHPLVVREFTIESEPPVARFKYPVEFLVDVSEAPEMKGWAERGARECERAYPLINEELKEDGYKPPHQVRLTLEGRSKGVAAAGDGRITGSAAYFKEHPDDVGALIHETAHIVQQYPGRDNPSWLVEGVADYVRFFKFEPGKLGRIDPERARYNQGYRVSAAFLAYLTEKHDREIVLKLNTLMRKGDYKDEVFRQLTGKTVQELDEEWRSTLPR